MSPSRIRSSVVPSTSPADFEVRGTRTYAVSTLWQQRTLPNHMALGWALACLALVSAVSPARGQMDPAEIQRQLLEEMGGEFLGGSGSAPPNRIGQLVSLAGMGCAAVTRSAKEHPRIAAATTVGALTTVWTVKEARRSGILISRSPRITLFRPSDVHLSKLLDTAAGAPIASPLSGVILSPLPEPDAEEELEDRDDDNGRVGASKMRPGMGLGAGKKKMRKKVGNGRTKSHSSGGTETMGEIDAAIAKARDAKIAGSYEEEMQHGRGAVTSVCAGVRVGVGLGLYHKFAQGLANLDVFDGRSDCELLATESSSEDLGSTLGLLTRSALSTWSLSPMRVVIRRETTASEPRVVEDDYNPGTENNRGREGDKRKKSKWKIKNRTSNSIGSQGGPGREAKVEGAGEGTAEGLVKAHRQYTLALSAVEGAGWSGTWVFRVTYDAGTEEVWFQTKLSQRKGAFGTTPGGDQEARVKRVNEDMLERGRKHAAVLKTREEQFMRVASLARNRAKKAKLLERDRIINPDKYKRVHRYMREDAYTTGRPTGRPVRWGEERRKNDIRLK